MIFLLHTPSAWTFRIVFGGMGKNEYREAAESMNIYFGVQWQLRQIKTIAFINTSIWKLFLYVYFLVIFHFDETAILQIVFQ